MGGDKELRLTENRIPLSSLERLLPRGNLNRREISSGTKTQQPTMNEYLQERSHVIKWLLSHNYPPLPVAPYQNPHQYPKRNKKGEIEYEKDRVTPKPLFAGKNPSYLDTNGTPHLVNHQKYQKRLPTEREIQTWFANPLNGVGTLGGWNDTIWIDFDVKQFVSQEECDCAERTSRADRTFYRLLENHPELATSWIEQTHSGGYRLGVRVRKKPKFTNFCLTPGGSHVGEALGTGRFTVLAPTIGSSGNPYRSLARATPVEVESLESIGIFPAKTQNVTPTLTTLPTPHPLVASVRGSIPLEMLGHDTSYKILNGANPKGDRSHSLATALNEWFGWANWAAVNGIAVQGTPEELAHHAGAALGIDSERVERIVKSINQTNVQPATIYWGNEENCWKKVESVLLSKRTNANLMWQRRTNSDCHKKARSSSQNEPSKMIYLDSEGASDGETKREPELQVHPGQTV